MIEAHKRGDVEEFKTLDAFRVKYWKNNVEDTYFLIKHGFSLGDVNSIPIIEKDIYIEAIVKDNKGGEE